MLWGLCIIEKKKNRMRSCTGESRQNLKRCQWRNPRQKGKQISVNFSLIQIDLSVWTNRPFHHSGRFTVNKKNTQTGDQWNSLDTPHKDRHWLPVPTGTVEGENFSQVFTYVKLHHLCMKATPCICCFCLSYNQLLWTCAPPFFAINWKDFVL